MKKSPLFYAIYALQFAVVFIGYYFSAYWGLHLHPTNVFAAAIWPPTGIALAAIYFGGFRLAPAVAAAAFAVNFVTGANLFAAFGIAIGNTLEACFGVYLLQNFNFRPYFDRLRDSAVFIAVALSVPFLSAIIGPLVLAISGSIQKEMLLQTSITWWVGDVIGALVIAPFLLKWFSRPVRLSSRSIFQLAESVLFLVVLSTLSILIFWDPVADIRDVVRPYLIFVPLTWGALRVGPRIVILGVVTVATIATIGTLMETGPFSPMLNGSALIFLQMFVGTLSMISLLFVAAIEERKKATEELEKNVVDLKEDVQEISAADRAKNEFIAILSHELRNPLAPVLSSLEFLRMRSSEFPEFKETFETMTDQIQRITRLLDDLLDITRISHKKFNLQIQRVTLQDILTHSISTAKQVIEKREHSLIARIPKEPIWVDADPLRLEQVFVNLLNNAAKYTNPGGQISIAAVLQRDGVEVRVKDNGIGLPPEMLAAIFEPFRQVQTGSSITGGLGIGLSLTKRFVELHSGVIEARSPGLGEGSEFIVWLPIVRDMLLQEGKPVTKPMQMPRAEAQPPMKQPQPSRDDSQGKKKRSVLIVDDNDDAALGIARLLRHSGHRVEIAHNSAGMFKIMENFHPEIILLDIGLPGESGYDIAPIIKQKIFPNPVLVALTGYGKEEDREKARQSGFNHHLTKPVSIADLENVLSSA